MNFPIIVQSDIPRNFPFMWENDILRIHKLVPYVVESGSKTEIADCCMGFLSEKPKNSFARWWWFLRDMESTYHKLNHQRRCAFNATATKPLVSTCVGINDLESDFLMIGLFIPSIVNSTFANSPYQNSAEDSISSFSRLGTFDFLGKQFFAMSGTSAINKKGETIHKGNVEKQIPSAFRILKTSIIKECGNISEVNYHWWLDASAAINMSEYSSARYGICRSDLMCEVEAVGTF